MAYTTKAVYIKQQKKPHMCNQDWDCYHINLQCANSANEINTCVYICQKNMYLLKPITLLNIIILDITK